MSKQIFCIPAIRNNYPAWEFIVFRVCHCVAPSVAVYRVVKVRAVEMFGMSHRSLIKRQARDENV